MGRARKPLLLHPIKELDFFEESHRYRWRGNWVLDNVSEVCSDELTPFAKQRIEETRHGPDGWELRGRTIHRCWEANLLNQPFVHEDRWDAWLDPLFDEPLFIAGRCLFAKQIGVAISQLANRHPLDRSDLFSNIQFRAFLQD